MIALALACLLAWPQSSVTRDLRPWTTAELIAYPPWIELSKAEIARTAPLRRLYDWLPEGTTAWTYRDERGRVWARKRGLMRLGDAVILWRRLAGKTGRWYEAELRLVIRIADGAWQWRTVRSDREKKYSARWRDLPPIGIPWMPQVQHNQVEDSR